MGKFSDILNSITADKMNQVSTGGTKKPENFSKDAQANAATQNGRIWIDKSIIDQYNQAPKQSNVFKPKAGYGNPGIPAEDKAEPKKNSVEKEEDEFAPATIDITDDEDGQLADIKSDSDYQRNDTLLSGLLGGISAALGGDPNAATGKVPEGRVARMSSQGEDAPLIEKRYDWQPFGEDTRDVYEDEDDNPYRNPLDMLSDDILAATNFIGGLRGTIASALGANDSDNYSIDVNGKKYTQEQFDQLNKNVSYEESSAEDADVFSYMQTPDGIAYNPATVTALDPRLAYSDEQPDQYDENGNGWVWQNVQLADGTIISRDQYDKANEVVVMANEATDEQKAIGRPYTISMTDQDGVVYSYKDLLSQDEGGKVTYEQDDKGFLGMAAENPDPVGAVLEGDFGEAASEFLPWLTDITLSTLPYLNPITAGLTAGARLSAASEGYDPDTFDWRTYTYEDVGDKFKGENGMPNSQGVANLAVPVADIATEYIGGWMPGGKALQEAASSGAKQIAKDAALEGFEEMIPGAISIYKNEGDNWGNDYVEDSEGNRTYLPTDPYQRLANIAPEMLENFLGGAILGAPLSALNQRGRKNQELFNMTFKEDVPEIRLPESLRMNLDEEWLKERNKES